MGGFQLGGVDLRRHLLDAILGFWENHSIDREHGGFLTLLNRDGSSYAGGEKYLVMQTRMIYSFATGYRLSGEERHLKHAEQGVEFLLRHLWDPEHKGWNYSATRDGKPLDKSKSPYGHAFAAYALGEYHRASGDHEALRKAEETYALMATKAWDPKHGGYYWLHHPDWTLKEPYKRADIVLHAIEGLSSLYAATHNPSYRDALKRHEALITGPMIDQTHQCLREAFQPDWRESLDHTKGLVSYGHNLEAAWFLWALEGILGTKAHSPLAHQLLNFAINHGWDPQHGGFYSTGTPQGRPQATEKIWWVQAEAIGALAIAYRLTGEEQYAKLLRKHLSFCSRYLYDAQHGEWYWSVEAHGAPKDTRKGSDWKAAYHLVQALNHAYRNLTLSQPTSYLP